MSKGLKNIISRKIHAEEFQLMPCGDKVGGDECPTSQEDLFYKKKLRLMMISCENEHPYGPASNVAVRREDILMASSHFRNECLLIDAVTIL